MARYLTLLMAPMPPPSSETLPALSEAHPARLFARTRELIDLDSTTGREREVGELLFARLAEIGPASGSVVKIPVDAERFNLFAHWGEPRVVLSTHMDCVPPFFPSSETEDEIRGRGACDAKGILAAMIAAIENLLAEGRSNFGLLIVVAEETDSVGADTANRWAQDADLSPRYLINGEPTENRLALGSKGTLFYRLEAEGKAAHSAYPELGISAIDALLAAIDRMRRVALPSDPILGETTINVGKIEGGRAANVIADQASAEILVRTVGPTETLRRDLAAAFAGVRIARHTETPAVRLGALPGFPTTVVKFTTDVPRLTAWGEPFLLGPGTIHVAHTPDERIAKADLVAAVGRYRQLVERLLDA
ncbi:MAG TPA: M20/M25/M40 family metallo-hydrolase [Thermoanaerobaculia bacterium]|jgi:acetylornithine deacetylase|nr:M20/M25/M40 family metallo-hydrolase [Thermoanaerobaculia bacterium]